MNIKKGEKFIFGIIFGLASTILMMLIFAIAMYLFKIDKCYSSVFATVCVAVGSLICAFYISRKIGEKGYLIGLIVGISYFSVITAVSLIVSKTGLGFNTAFHLAIITLSSVIGGVMGVNKKQSKIL